MMKYVKVIRWRDFKKEM